MWLLFSLGLGFLAFYFNLIIHRSWNTSWSEVYIYFSIQLCYCTDFSSKIHQEHNTFRRRLLEQAENIAVKTLWQL